MGNSGSGLAPTTTAAEDSCSTNPDQLQQPTRQLASQTVSSGNEVPSRRDENFNHMKDGPLPQQHQDVVYCSSLANVKVSPNRRSSLGRDVEQPGPSGMDSHAQQLISSASGMTPVTLPTHHVSKQSALPPSSGGVTYPTYGGRFPTHMSLPPFPSYVPVGGPGQLVRYPPVESYSAMLANMGTQFQMAQEQGHVLQHSYIPGGYITLAGPHGSMPPVLIPAASLHDVSREGSVANSSPGHIPLGGPQVHHLSGMSTSERSPTYRTPDISYSKPEHHSPSSHPVSYGDIYRDPYAVSSRAYGAAQSISSSSLRRGVDSLRQSGPHESGSNIGQPRIPSLEDILGKTTYRHASGPGGIKVELPPPTIGIHIGARPTNLGHPNMALPPPLVHKSNLYVEPSRDSSKVVASPLSAPVACTGEPFTGRMGPPYLQPLTSRSLHSQLQGNRLLTETYAKNSLSYPGSSSREANLQRSNSSPGSSKPWPPTDPPHVNKPEPFQVKQEPGTRDVPEERPASASTDGHKSPKDRKSVQSSRPILTSQAPPPMANVPSYFTRGSIIQLASRELRRVEELQTEDFIRSAQLTDGLKVDSSTVSKIEEDPERNVANISFLVGEHNAQVTVEARLDHPFFVYGQGWSSVCPEVSQKCYDLQCHTLAVGDVCVSLTVVEKISPEPGRPPPLCPASGTGPVVYSQQQLIMNSPERKRQRFHETRMTQIEESVERDSAVAKVPTSVKSKSLEHQSGQISERPSQPKEVVVDQNRNIVTSHTSKTPAGQRERWNQPPKRRWSDPIKTPQGPPESKDHLSSAPHQSPLSKLKEET